VPLDASFAQWAAVRGDRRISGPFQKLPVLQVGDLYVAETLVIQAFLHRQLGDETLLSNEDNLRHAMLVSSLYNDVMLPIGMFIWAELSHTGVDVASFGRYTVERIIGHWQTLAVTLDEWDWWRRAGDRPVMLADCLLWEELSVMRHVFGRRFDLAALPTLAAFHEGFSGRAVCERVLAAKRRPVTGRPQEAEALDRLRGLLGG